MKQNIQNSLANNEKNNIRLRNKESPWGVSSAPIFMGVSLGFCSVRAQNALTGVYGVCITHVLLCAFTTFFQDDANVMLQSDGDAHSKFTQFRHISKSMAGNTPD